MPHDVARAKSNRGRPAARRQGWHAIAIDVRVQGSISARVQQRQRRESYSARPRIPSGERHRRPCCTYASRPRLAVRRLDMCACGCLQYTVTSSSRARLYTAACICMAYHQIQHRQRPLQLQRCALPCRLAPSAICHARWLKLKPVTRASRIVIVYEKRRQLRVLFSRERQSYT